MAMRDRLLAALDTTIYAIGTDESYDAHVYRLDYQEPQLVVDGALDHETTPSHEVEIRTTDSGGLTYDKTFTITVTDVNEAPTDISLSNTSIIENADAETVVGEVGGTDPDEGDVLAFSLASSEGCSGTDNDVFDVVDLGEDGGWVLRVAGDLDYEAGPSREICVRATDPVGGTYDKAFTITVTDEEIDLVMTKCELLYYDADAGTVELSWEVKNDGPDFQSNWVYMEIKHSTNDTIARTNSDERIYQLKIEVGDLLPGNTLGGTNIAGFTDVPEYDLNTDYVGCYIDAGSTSREAESDEENNAVSAGRINAEPTALALTLEREKVDENSLVGTVVGTLSTADASPNDTHSYTIGDGVDVVVTMAVPSAHGDEPDELPFAIYGNTLEVSGPIDFENDQSFTFTIRTTDQGGLFFELEVTIEIQDVNETPTDIDLSNSSVEENSPDGTVIGSLTSVDEDLDDPPTYSIVAGGDPFAIVDGEGATVTQLTSPDMGPANGPIHAAECTNGEANVVEIGPTTYFFHVEDPSTLDIGIYGIQDGSVWSVTDEGNRPPNGIPG